MSKCGVAAVQHATLRCRALVYNCCVGVGERKVGTPVKSKDQNSALLLACNIFHQRKSLNSGATHSDGSKRSAKYTTRTAALTNASGLLHQQHIPKQTVLVKRWRCPWEKGELRVFNMYKFIQCLVYS